MIKFNNISKTYSKQTVLDVESLEIQPGQAFGLVGNNGAGKTTLFSTLLDLIKPSTGEVLNNDINEFSEVLEGFGYEKNGDEVMYSGISGDQIHTDIFIGPTYYQRLKIMVEDIVKSGKIQKDDLTIVVIDSLK